MTQALPVNHELLVCSRDTLSALDVTLGNEGAAVQVWRWRAQDQTDLPDAFKGLFRGIDECKPFDGGRRILITSSSGGAALLDRVAGRVLFYARASNAHSADLLPNGRVAVAASHYPDGEGDRLILFDIDKPDQPLWHDDLTWGHGVVSDEARQVVWALSTEDVRSYELRDWDSAAPRLAEVTRTPLPEKGGHDLYPVPNTPHLSVTTHTHCWLFDRDSLRITPHPDFADHAKVKSLCRHPLTGQTVYVQGNDEHWWAEDIHFLNPDGAYHVSDAHFYKARWGVGLG